MLFGYNFHYYTKRHILNKNILKKATFFLLIVLAFSITGCGDKKSNTKDTDVTSVEKNFPSSRIQMPDDFEQTYTLTDKNKKTYTATVTKEKLIFENIAQPITIVTIFNTACLSCIAQITDLSKIQRKHKDKLFIANLLLEEIPENTLNAFLQKHHLTNSIFNYRNNTKFTDTMFELLKVDEDTSLPLTLIYKNGNFVSFFEGPIPIEMITHDIQQLLEH